MTLFIRKTGDEKFEQFVPEGQTLSGFEKFKVQEFILSLSEKKGRHFFLLRGRAKL